MKKIFGLFNNFVYLKPFKMLNFGYWAVGNIINFSAVLTIIYLVLMLIILIGIFGLKKVHFAFNLTIYLRIFKIIFNDYYIRK